MNYHIVIPARYRSTRLPGKPLQMIAGKTLLEHVYQRAVAAATTSIVIATDDERIAAEAGLFGAEAELTSPDHPSGSDRIAECVRKRGWGGQDIVVNLQGDEPLMPSACLDQVAGLLDASPQAAVASLWQASNEEAEYLDPHVVKVVVNQQSMAMYFSRAPIPHLSHHESGLVKRHVGLYAYRVADLLELIEQPPSQLEIAESLEQLRWLEAGKQIVMAPAEQAIPAGVDTQTDLKRVEEILSSD